MTPEEQKDRDRNLAMLTWNRYAYARDHGHLEYVRKADVCNEFFRGKQWRSEDINELSAAGRPHLTINKIKPTVSNLLGEQIQNRADIAYRPKDGALPLTAETLTKVFKHISEINQLDWKRSDVFFDGIVTDRGFFDMRMEFNESMTGDVCVTHLNPKNVLPDPDAEDMDPDTWNEVFVTKWMTIDDIELLYGKAKADLIRGRENSALPFGYDSIDRVRDRLGERWGYSDHGVYEDMNVVRNIRVIERQHRMLTKVKHLVDPKTGDMRQIPSEWSSERATKVADQYGLAVVKKLVKRIMWDVIADGEVMHSDWSPYKHFTVIPYFPYFQHGNTSGIVEDLLDPQELLNKSLSQELHIINSTANGGWKIKAGSLTNMSIEELEQRGSQTGLVLSLDDINDAEKIQANVTPQGVDRLSFKAEEHIKGISNVSDSMQGQDREDVSGKAIQQKRAAGVTAHAKPIDSLVRTDFFIARNALDLIQSFYTEERVLTITHDRMTGQVEDVPLNQPQEDGTVLNDLTMGTYEVVISSVPLRETLEDSQFEQAMSMRESGIQIPDTDIIASSRLLKKGEIIKRMEAAASSPEAQQDRQLSVDERTANIEKTKAETTARLSDAQLKGAKTAGAAVDASKEASAPPDQGEDPVVKAHEHEEEMRMKREKHDQDMALQREKHSNDLDMKQRQAEQDAMRAEHDQLMERKASAQASVATKDPAVKPARKSAPKKPATKKAIPA